MKYTITYSKLDGTNTQVALSDGPTPAADTPKILVSSIRLYFNNII